MATSIVDIASSSSALTNLGYLHDGYADGGSRIMHYIDQAGHTSYTTNLLKMWFKLDSGITLKYFRMYSNHAADNFTLKTAVNLADETGTEVMSVIGGAGAFEEWANYYSMTSGATAQWFYLNITKWTNVQYFQIIEVEFYGDGPFVLATIELVGDSPYEQPQYTVYVEPGYTIKNANGDDVSSDYIVVTTGSVDVNNAGEYTLTYTASFTDTSGPSISIDRTVNVIDAVNPEITINGDNPVNISHGLTYTDQGAFANDDVDGNITNSIQVSSNVNTSIVGTYTVTYSVADTAGNTTSATRTINVVDIIGPVIELQGDNPYSMYLNGTYSEPGYTATDNIDGEIDVNNVTTTDNIDASTVGTYTITYTATDSAGNEGTAIRTVNIVLDTVGPVITLEGENPYTLDLNGTYIEQGFTVDDNADGEIDVNNVTITNNIDVNTAGTYEVSYSVTDGAGNNTVVIRTVNVQILVAFNSSIAYIRRDDLATLINSFAEVSSLKEIYNMWYNNTQIAGGTDCWIYYAYSSIFNEVLYTTRKIEFFSKNDGTYEWIDNEIIVNATVTSNGLSVADLTDYTSFYSGLEPFNINMSSTSINTVNTLLNNSGYSLYNYIQIFNIWYNETNTFDMDYDNTTREVDVWVYVLTDQTAMEDILDKHATPIEPITDFDEKQITIEMLKPYLLEGGNVQPIFETRKLKYTVTNNNASYTWTLYTNETIESTINDTGYSIISSIDNYKLSYFYFDSYTVVRESSKEALRSLYLAYYNSTKKLKKINEVWYNKLDINSSVTNDSEGPLITVLGQNPMNIIQNSVSSYREIGVVAIDNVDSDVTDQITVTYTNKATNITESTIDISIVGEYIVTYTVQDSAGNISTATRDLNIVADTVGPVLTILGDNPTQIVLGSINTYVDGGASAIDSIDGDITDQIVITNIDTVNLTTIGIYTITYTIEDSAGNIDTKNRTVAVSEDTNIVAPVITLIGYRSKYIIMNSVASYTDEGATATDDEDGTVTVTTSGTVNTTVIGTYELTYTAQDSVGNSTTAIRTIYVIEEADSVPPTIILLNGDSNIELDVGGTYTEEGATATDTKDGSVSVTVSGDNVDTSTDGTYTITYTATDNAGNISVMNRIVNVGSTSTGGESSVPTTIYGNKNSQAGADGSLASQGVNNIIISSTIGPIWGWASLKNNQSMGNNAYTQAGGPVYINPRASAPWQYVCFHRDDNYIKFTYFNIVNGVYDHYRRYYIAMSPVTDLDDYTSTFDFNNNIAFNSDIQAENTDADFQSLFKAGAQYTLSQLETGTPLPVPGLEISLPELPELTLVGDNPLFIEKGSITEYTDPGCDGGGELITVGGDIVNTNVAGEYKITFTASNNGGSTTIVRRVYITDGGGESGGGDSGSGDSGSGDSGSGDIGSGDTEPPVVTFAGDSVIDISIGDSYTDEGGTTAIDNVDSSLTVQTSGTVNTSIVGSYPIIYTATDVAGNTGFNYRKINVFPAIYSGGWLEFNNKQDALVNLRSANGFSANGISHGILKCNLYIMALGEFLFIMSASATTWNKIDKVTFEVSTDPHITNQYGTYLNLTEGYHEFKVEWTTTVQTYYIDNISVHSSNKSVYNDSNNYIGGLDCWHATTNSELDVNKKFFISNLYIEDVTSGNVFTMDYNEYPTSVGQTEREFVESGGFMPWATNSASLDGFMIYPGSRTIPPEITIAGDTTINIIKNIVYIDEGAISTAGPVTSSGTVDISTVGVYPIVYTYNITYIINFIYYINTAVRIVNVIDNPDNEGPVITITGSNPVEITLGSAYVDEGATATDNVDGTVSVVTSGDTITETSEEGEYTITYTATDNAGNVSTATRTVIIVSSPYLYSCFYMSTNASVVDDNGMKYLFNGDTSYNADKKYGLGVGTYTIKNIPAEHPMALLNEGKTHLITYTGDDANKSSKSVTSTTADGTYDFYHGDITITVLGNFRSLSIYCYNHGYMGGENLLVYKEACEIGLPESLNIKYTLGLYNSSNVVVNDSKYMFNGHTTYNSNYQYGLGTGTYTIKNIPEEHPMAILNAGKTLQISYSGNSTTKSSKEVTSTTADGTYDFYHGDITIMVNSNFDKVSIYCYNHGYMGGENLLVYSSDCKIQVPLIDNSSLSLSETTITTSDIGMKIYGTGKDLDEDGLSILDSKINNKLDVKYNKNTRNWNTLMNIEPLLTVGSGLEDGLSSNNYFQIYNNIDYNIVQKIPELISKYNETYGEEIGIDKFYESDEIDNAHILDCYMKFYLLSNPISELYTSLEYDRVINSWKVKNPTEVYNSVKANNTVKYSVFRLNHLNNKQDDLKEKYNIVYPLHSIIQIYKLWYNSSSAGDEIVDGIMFYSYKEIDDVFVKTEFATVNILYTVITDTFSVMSETPTIRSYDYNGEDL